MLLGAYLLDTAISRMGSLPDLAEYESTTIHTQLIAMISEGKMTKTFSRSRAEIIRNTQDLKKYSKSKKRKKNSQL